MTIISNTVTNQRGQPISGALVEIRDDQGALADTGGANPLVTDSRGFWQAELAPGATFSLVISYGGSQLSRSQFVCGTNIIEVRGGIELAQIEFGGVLIDAQPITFNSSFSMETAESLAQPSATKLTTCTIS